MSSPVTPPSAACPPPHSGAIGSLGAFWPLIEPLLAALAPRVLCEVGVESGAFANVLLAWCRAHRCRYYGVDPAEIIGADELRRLEPSEGALIQARSLETLPALEPCGVYFLDGDHNFHTVRNELAAIADRAQEHPAGSGPLVFVHDVGWPWGRRDMYYAPETVPTDARHEFSENLGVIIGSDELVDGGLRSPGNYAIATRPGGERNGVLTAVESFLADPAEEASRGRWEMFMVPVAFGLAVLYRPSSLPPACLQALEKLQNSVRRMDRFLGNLESSYLELFLFSQEILVAHERAQAHAASVQTHADQVQTHANGMQEYVSGLEKSYHELQSSYQALLTHSDSLLKEYHSLDAHRKNLEAEIARLTPTQVSPAE